MNLPLPWKRRPDAAVAATPATAPPPRRMPSVAAAGRGRRPGLSNPEAIHARRRQERRRQRIAFILGGALILAILAVVMVGVYQQFILPPRVTAGEVRDVRFTMGDLVERIRVLQGINRYQGGRVDFSRVPFQLLTDLLHAEILRQAAPGLGINVTAEDIDQTISDQFRPEPAPGQETDDAQLDAELDNAYIGFPHPGQPHRRRLPPHRRGKAATARAVHPDAGVPT